MAYDVAVVGGGPGGYVAAIRASQLGLKTILIERDRVGGTCLNWGCIPTKALLRNADVLNLVKNARDWGISLDNVQADYGKAYSRSRKIVERLVKGVEFLLGNVGVEIRQATASFDGPHRLRLSSGELIDANSIIIATGAESRQIPGLDVDGQQVLTSHHTVTLQQQPASILVAGGGAIGCEFGYLFRSYGAKVYIVEMMDHLLPLEDPESSTILEKAFVKSGIRVMTGSKVEKLETNADGVTATVITPKGPESLTVEKVLVAIGVKPELADLELARAGVALERDWVKVDGQMRTNVEGIYAIGDAAGPPYLAHVASAQGVVAAEVIAGHSARPLVYSDMPRATYCEPQVASLGLTEQQARDKGANVKVGRFSLRSSGKALALGSHEGQIKLVSDGDTGEILGIHMVGPDVTELLGEYAVAKHAELTVEDVARTVHPHPTLSEGLMEVALVSLGEAVNVPNN